EGCAAGVPLLTAPTPEAPRSRRRSRLSGRPPAAAAARESRRRDHHRLAGRAHARGPAAAAHDLDRGAGGRARSRSEARGSNLAPVRLRDRVAIITGTAQGIGKAYALPFAREGAHVEVADIRDQQARAEAAECAALGPAALSLRLRG